MGGWKSDGWIEGGMNGWTDRWMGDEWMEGGMDDGWTDEWTDHGDHLDGSILALCQGSAHHCCSCICCP